MSFSRIILLLRECGNMNFLNRCVWVALLAFWFLSQPGLAVDDAGRDLREMQEQNRRREVLDTAHQELVRRAAEKPQEREKKLAPEVPEVSFELKKVIHTPSRVLSEKELSEIFSKYEGRVVFLKDLYALLDEVNALYERKGYIVAKAFLRPQNIENGTVEITLVEGETESAEITGNETTNESYIRARVPLKKGEVSNFRQLQKRLGRFNTLNDAQLRIEIAPGTEFGKTRYMLTVVEPKQVGGSIFADNAGSRDSGRARVGFSVTNRSLTGRRDALSVSGVMSEGSRAGYLSYTTPIGSAGGALEVSAGANQVHNVRGPWHGIADIRSYAQSFTARWSYPWYAGPKGRQGYFIEYAYRRNRTKVDGVDTTNNRTHSVTGGVEFLTYWNHALLYHSWSVAYTSKDDHVFDEKSHYMLYKLYALYQNIDPRNGRTLSARINAGWGSSDTDSSDMMSIGGSSSVRGYDKDIISADGGASINLEYSIPVSRDRKWQVFGFVDYGFLWDDDNLNDDSYLISTGFGLKAQIARNALLNLTLGFPLKRTINGTRRDQFRLDLSASWWL